MKRFDLLTPKARKNSDKPFWHRIGTAFEDDRGGFTLYLDSLPTADAEGRTVVKMWEAKPRDGQPQDRQSAPQGGGYGGGMDDSIPFAPEWRA